MAEMDSEYITTVKPGDRGMDVAYYQAILHNLTGKLIAKTGPAHNGIDGIYSGTMAEDVGAYQSAHLMEPNGTIDSDTARLLVQNFTDRQKMQNTDGELTQDVIKRLKTVEPSLNKTIDALTKAQHAGQAAGSSIKKQTPPDIETSPGSPSLLDGPGHIVIQKPLSQRT